MPFLISKKYQNDYWFKQNLLDDHSSNWTEGIKIIKDRFKSRFFDPIDKIKNEKTCGFIIMSIDCLLIETLMQFYLGVESTDKKYKGEHRKAFRDFFKQSKYFQPHFRTDKICYTFYSHFRCGLLHQAQTKNKSLIKIKQSYLLRLVNDKEIEKGLIIDREKFHHNLFLEFEDYLFKLKTNANNFIEENLRVNAITKMNNICT